MKKLQLMIHCLMILWRVTDFQEKEVEVNSNKTGDHSDKMEVHFDKQSE